MKRLRLMLTGGVGLLAALALSAAPAAAEFQAPQKQGKGRVIVSGEFILGTAAVTCVPSEVIGQWHIQTKGQIKAQPTEALKGPRLGVQVKSWGKCATKIGGKEPATETTVKACDLQVVQRQSGFASGGVVTPCLLKIGGEVKEPLCEIQIPAGMETAAGSDQGINVGLLETTFTTGQNPKFKVNVTKGGVGQAEGEGVFTQSVGKNVLCPLPKTTEKAELRGLEVEAEGLTAT